MSKMRVIQYGSESYIPIHLAPIKELISKHNVDEDIPSTHIIPIPLNKMKHEAEWREDKFNIYLNHIQFSNNRYRIEITRGLQSDTGEQRRHLGYNLNKDDDIMLVPLKGSYFGNMEDEVLAKYATTNVNNI